MGRDRVVSAAQPGPGFGLVPARRFVVDSPVAAFEIGPGDRILVGSGEVVTAGVLLAERRRDPRLDIGPPIAQAAPGEGSEPRSLRPGDWWAGDGHEVGSTVLRRRRPRAPAGELLHPERGRWRIVTGEHLEPLEVPADGIVREVVPGRMIGVAFEGHGLEGAFVAGGPTRGRLEILPSEAGLRGALDVSRTGTILVASGRIDSEAISRARAMGVRGIVVPGLAGKDMRDLLASEDRQRVSLQPRVPFAVLVLDGTLRRPVPSPISALLARLAGQQVGIVTDPPLLLFEPPAHPPVPPVGWIRVRHGERIGREGRWLEAVGLRRFAAGVHLEAARVELDDLEQVVLPIADLERLV